MRQKSCRFLTDLPLSVSKDHREITTISLETRPCHDMTSIAITLSDPHSPSHAIRVMFAAVRSLFADRNSVQGDIITEPAVSDISNCTIDGLYGGIAEIPHQQSVRSAECRVVWANIALSHNSRLAGAHESHEPIRTVGSAAWGRAEEDVLAR